MCTNPGDNHVALVALVIGAVCLVMGIDIKVVLALLAAVFAYVNSNTIANLVKDLAPRAFALAEKGIDAWTKKHRQ